MRVTLKAALALTATGMLMMPHVSASAQETGQSKSQSYSIASTPVGTLLDDPEASAILKRLIPTVFANEMFQTMGRSQTLEAIQQYEPVELTDEKLAEIQAEFDKLSDGD